MTLVPATTPLSTNPIELNGAHTHSVTVTSKTDRIAEHIKAVLELLGHDTSNQGINETPTRVAKFLQEFHQDVDFHALLKAGFEGQHGPDAMVIQQHIPFRALCEHHLLPFFGRASIGYIPEGRVVGLSKLTRLVQAAGTKRPSTQEFVTNMIADALNDVMTPKGVIVITKAVHTCMSVRGINAPDVETSVSALRGVFLLVPAARAEFLSITSSRGA